MGKISGGKIRKNPLNAILYGFVSLMTAVLMGTLLMIMVYCIPVDYIRSNIRVSADIQLKEDIGYYWAPYLGQTHLDNFTDAIMANNAAFIGTGSAVRDAMNNPRVAVDGGTQTTSLLMSVTQDDLEGLSVVNYPRYWHGYLVWLKPLLSIMNMGEIRILMMGIQFILLVSVLIELGRQMGGRLLWAFAVSVLCMNPISMALSMTFSCVYTILLVAVYVMMRRKLYMSDKYWKLFLWIGISTAFFDLLTYPLAALGIPLVLLIMLGNGTLKDNMKRLAGSTLSWCAGYAGMWSGKWIVASVITGDNIIKNGIDSVLYRASGDSVAEAGVSSDSAIAVILINFRQLVNVPFVCALVIAVSVILTMAAQGRLRIERDRARMLPVSIVALYPLLWYAIIKNHSMVHSWMTYRSLSVTICVVAIMVLGLMGEDKREHSIEQLEKRR